MYIDLDEIVWAQRKTVAKVLYESVFDFARIILWNQGGRELRVPFNYVQKKRLFFAYPVVVSCIDSVQYMYEYIE